MDEVVVARYWCYMCSQMVSLNMEIEIKCPSCHSGFVEEMVGRGDTDITDLVGVDQSPSMRGPVMLGTIGSDASRRRRYQRHEQGDELNQDRELVSMFRRRRRNLAIFRLIQDLEDRIRSDSENTDGEGGSGSLNNTVVLRALFDNQNRGQDSENTVGGVSLGDYYLDSSLDLLLQHLAENDPNRYGTPPAQKEAVNALPTVKIQESTSCSICLEDFVVNSKAKEMPCKHFFHSECILPWLELHSSCPVCRFELPAEESKESGGSSNVNRADGNAEDGNASMSRFLINVPWPFNELFPSTGSQNNHGNPPNPSSESNAYADNN